MTSVLNTTGARWAAACVAGRSGRALVYRAAETLPEQSAASQRGRPRVLADEDGVLLAGHARIRAAAKLGLKSIPVTVVRG